MERIFVAYVPASSPEDVKHAIHRGIQALGIPVPARRRILIQPACPWAHPRFAPHAFTPLALLEAVRVLFSDNVLVIGASSLPGFPSRYALKQAGYWAWARRHRVPLWPLDERPAQRSGEEALVPQGVREADGLIALPRLTGSGFLGFAGAARHHLFLLSPSSHLQAYPRLPEALIDALTVRPPDLIVLDATQVLHRGGELAGEPIPFSLLIIGTNILAVDRIAAVLYGLDPMEVPWIRLAIQRGLASPSMEDLQILGDLSLEDLRHLGEKIVHADPLPERYAWPPQVRVYRSEAEPLWNIPGALMETLWVLERGGISLAKAREAAIVIGPIGELPRPRTDTAAAILLGDSARADYRGYSRIVRLPGRHVPVARLLLDLPYILQVASMRSELGWGFLWESVRYALRRRS
ncbi:DUF362 domain-containing protein [Thermoflexus sp.]|uniref:DUF362 domain-containing protein n=2 Tax=Thermoflexus sp. TaxID=1969742 RepID=UPI0025E7DF48|nr:DUF362 domain-containing protein [Thermoflexus sp.]MCS7350779.1 DUF362 domain-containing protein [Thermoflexus sp.]MCX7689863.1 DUF362 domain-containing protein [Thermoflexus sp.]MDW8180230.1 DUF362 domain-containing protein [Anaerolineae bacterium]MDW8183797.1 DUF362 domain-containing protein [Anaerolineae bacterium]